MNARRRVKTYLVIDEGNFLRYALHDQLELKFQILAREYGVVVLLDFCRNALGFCGFYRFQSSRKASNSSLNLLDLMLLLF